MYKDAHRREVPFDAFIDRILQPHAENDAYLTAYNSARNVETLSVLNDDLGFLDKFLDREAPNPDGMMWIGSAGTVTSLHHDLTNSVIAPLVGRKRGKILPASEVGKLHNHQHVFSNVRDLESPNLNSLVNPRLAELRTYDLVLRPDGILFMGLARWHQVKSLDFSVTVT